MILARQLVGLEEFVLRNPRSVLEVKKLPGVAIVSALKVWNLTASTPQEAALRTISHMISRLAYLPPSSAMMNGDLDEARNEVIGSSRLRRHKEIWQMA